MSDLTTPATPVSQEPVPFSFEKNHGEFFILCLKTVLLTAVTLGIYSFWGRVAITKYLYNHTSFGRHSFDYHATGKELFIGFLKAIGILAVAAIIIGIIVGIISKIIPFAGSTLLVILYGAAVLLLPPYLMVGKWRFWLSRSSYCNVRFKHTGDYKELRGIWIRGVLLSIVTLGFYSPVLMNKIQKFYTDHNQFGTLTFNYTGQNKEYFMMWLKGLVLTIVTLGVYSFWYAAKVNRYILSHTTLDQRPLGCTMTGGGLFMLSITNLLIVIGTLTFGFPIAANRMYHYFFSNITLAIDPEQLSTVADTMDSGASALANGLEDAASVVDAIAGVI